MKTCQICGHVEADAAETCAMCGEASFSAPAEGSTEPKAPEPDKAPARARKR